MSTQPTFYNDGTWTAGFQVGADKPTWPFLNDVSPPNTYSKITELSYRILPASYAPLIGTRTTYTNLLLQSSAFTTTWTSTNVTPTAAGRANPDTGAVDMFKCLETVTNGEHYVSQAYASFTAASYVLSFFVAGGLGRDYVYAKVNDGTSDHTCFFNYTTGTVGTASGGVGSILAMPDGSYRCSIALTAAAGSGYVRIQSASDGSTTSYAGDVAKGFYVWGAQLELASSVGPYISTSTVSRAISSPSWLPSVDTFAYLVYESELGIDSLQRASFMRKYGRIPAPQISYPGSRYIPLPGVSALGETVESTAVNWVQNESIGASLYVLDSDTIFIETQNAFYGVLKSQSSRVIGVASGGTFTLTYNGSTTAALNWNDSNATIAAAINGLASVSAAGLTATVINLLSTSTGGQLQVTWGGATPIYSITMNAGSLTVSTSANTTTQTQSSQVQIIYLPDHYTITSHGFNTALDLAVRTNLGTGVVELFSSGQWGSINANTVWISNLTSSALGVQFGTFLRNYVPGQTYLVRTRVTETFYLPGVTSGIATPADISSPIGLQNPLDFMNAIITSSGFQLYQSEGPQPWLGTQIYVVKSVDVNVSDFT